jgi:ComEC/Rec2-related protein
MNLKQLTSKAHQIGSFATLKMTNFFNNQLNPPWKDYPVRLGLPPLRKAKGNLVRQLLHIKRYFSSSNLFLLFVLIITLLNCFLAFKSYSWQTNLWNNLEQVFSGEVRIVKENRQQFGSRWQAKTDLGDIFLEGKTKYQLGYKYFVQGNLVRFQLDKASDDNKVDFDSYFISTGKVGKIKNPEVVTEIEGCDPECLIIQKVAGFRSSMSYYYDQQICKNLHWINEFFGNKCVQPLAWANGLVIGNGDLFDKATKSEIKKLGLTHLIVVSGTQVSLIFAVLEVALAQLNLKRKWRWLLCIFGIGFLVLIVGFQAPVLRSSLSILLSTFGLIFLGRRLNSFRALVYSGLILLWLNPFFLISYSFWLSIVATFGLLVSTQFSKSIKALPEVEFLNSFKDIALATVGTFLYTLPLIVNLSGGISPIAIVSNLFVLPIINIVTILDILGFIPYVGEVFLLFSTAIQNVIIVLLKDLVQFANVVKFTSFGLIEMVCYWLVLTILVVIIKKLFKLIHD